MEREILETTIKEIKDERLCRHDKNRRRCSCPHEPDELDCFMCIRACIFISVIQIHDDLETGEVRLDFHTANDVCDSFNELDTADEMLQSWIESKYPQQFKEKRQQIMRERAGRECSRERYRI